MYNQIELCRGNWQDKLKRIALLGSDVQFLKILKIESIGVVLAVYETQEISE